MLLSGQYGIWGGAELLVRQDRQGQALGATEGVGVGVGMGHWLWVRQASLGLNNRHPSEKKTQKTYHLSFILKHFDD